MGTDFPVIRSTPTTSTHSVTTVNDTVETQMFEVAKASTYRLSMYVDVQTLITAVEGGTVTFRLYNKIDDTNYRLILSGGFTVGTSVDHPVIEVNAVRGYTKLTVQCSTDVTTTRVLPYRYITEDLGP